MVLIEPLTLFLVVFKKTILKKNSFGQLLSEEIVGNDKLQEKVLYIGLENNKSNKFF